MRTLLLVAKLSFSVNGRIMRGYLSLFFWLDELLGIGTVCVLFYVRLGY